MAETHEIVCTQHLQSGGGCASVGHYDEHNDMIHVVIGRWPSSATVVLVGDDAGRFLTALSTAIGMRNAHKQREAEAKGKAETPQEATLIP